MLIQQYKQLLDRYYTLIRMEDWWDGRREGLVRQMDVVWTKLSKGGREQVEAYSKRVYEAGLV